MPPASLDPNENPRAIGVIGLAVLLFVFRADTRTPAAALDQAGHFVDEVERRFGEINPPAAQK